MKVLKNIEKIVVIGDKVLVRPDEAPGKTDGGLYLPPSVAEREKVQSGYIIRTGPGYPVAPPADEEPWKESNEGAKFIPLQVKEGDYAVYLKKDALEVEFEGEKLFIISQSSILMVLRDELPEF